MDTAGVVVSMPTVRLGDHAHILGPTGCGKTAFTLGFSAQVLAKTDHALVIIDAKGQLCEELSGRVLPRIEELGHLRDRKVGVVRPLQGDPLPLDPLVSWKGVSAESQAFTVSKLISSYTGVGERAEGVLIDLVRVAIELKLNLVDIVSILKRPELGEQLAGRVKKAELKWFLTDGLASTPSATLASMVTRLSRLLALPEARALLAGRLSVRGEDLLTDDVTIVSLAGAPAGHQASADLVGALILSLIAGAVFTRDDSGTHRPVVLVLDEFQEFAKHSADDVERMLAMGRSKGVRLVLANQTMAQVRAASTKLAGSTETNCGLKLLFQPSVTEIQSIEPLLAATGRVPNPLAPDEWLSVEDERRALARRLRRLRKRECVLVDRSRAHATQITTLTVPFDEMPERELEAPSTDRTKPLKELLRRSQSKLTLNDPDPEECEEADDAAPRGKRSGRRGNKKKSKRSKKRPDLRMPS
jgi:hypothetical protein